MSEPTPDDLGERITTAAAEPAAATVDGQSATARTIDELIKADRHLAQRRAATAPRFGLGLSRILPGSGLGGGQ